ncbi:phosphoadenylyl-sulfate reductase [Thalassotalea sp. G2M2-11]|uniref:phosphoadenylyl-sulfate reductase n=1 Tax=Thalassotalea sp. G2M2-11 TaxID=2787627 RepID=UPI001F49A94E|nr:phosphoadenylyl-sulfate reductase [Thalassotalea sp. G2M2-11]
MTEYLDTEIAYWSSHVGSLNAMQRIEWSLDNLPQEFILSSSFGIQSAVMLHMTTQIYPNIPVILTDTGYLFPETYEFLEQLTEQLQLNLHVYKAKESATWQLKKYGKLWTQGTEGLKKYHYINKVEPFDRAMKELNANTWFSGIRREQSSFRNSVPFVDSIRGHIKVHPILDWMARDVHEYLKKHHLPYHPLFTKGYTSIGDTHSTKPIHHVTTEDEIRFNGTQRECGLHCVNK